MALYDKENYFVFVHKVAEDTFEIYYPKTVAQQVVTGKNATLADHLTAPAHINAAQREMLNKAGQPGGIARLDDKGHLPLDNFDVSFVLIKIQFDDIHQMLDDTDTKSGSMAFVLDATDDPSVESGWAVYRRTNTIIDQQYGGRLGIDWVKVYEKESIDVNVTWEIIKRDTGMTSEPEEIDQMVADEHVHANKSVIDKLGINSNGKLTYDGYEVAYLADVSSYHWDDYADKSAMRIGDFWMKGSICQNWWDDPTIEYAGNSCYEKYMDQDGLVTAPKLRTNDATTARRMFYRCYSLDEVPQYDWRSLLDAQSMFEEASSLELVPHMNTEKLDNAERMFYGATSLRQSPEMSLNSATNMKEIFYGCLNLTHVNPFGYTKNVTDMTRAFSGDDALEKIDSAINFSSISDASKLTDIFKDCIELNKLRFAKDTLSVSIDVSGTNLDEESLESVFNGLVKYTGISESAPTINVKGINAMEDLAPTIKAIPFNKGWNVEEDAVQYDTNTVSEVQDAIQNASAGETIILNSEINTVGNAIQSTADDVSIVMNNDIIGDGGNSSGIRVSSGSMSLAGTGIVVNTTPYSSSNASGVISVTGDGELTFNGSGISAVIDDDPVNKGQFGVTVYDDAKLTVNDGDFEAGWYCLSGNGSKTSADSVTTVNGGSMHSVADYAIYHPHAGSLIINGCLITGAAGAIAINNGYLEINGGILSVTGGGDTGDASDGTGGLGEACINFNARYGDVTCRITGGAFVVATDEAVLFNIGTAHTVDLQISGGRFSIKPLDEWIAPGYKCSDTLDSDGLYEVVKI